MVLLQLRLAARIALFGWVAFASGSLAAAQMRYPFCPLTAPEHTLEVVHVAAKVDLPKEVLRASILSPRHGDMNFEVQTLADGKIACVTPLSATFSLLVPFAIDAIERELAEHRLPPSEKPRLIRMADPRPLPPRGHVRVTTVHDLSHPTPEELKDPEVEALTCNNGDVDVLLEAIRRMKRSPGDKSYDKQIECANAAVALAPDSIAVHFVAGEVFLQAALSRQPGSEEIARLHRISMGHYRAALAFAPGFIEARNGIRGNLNGLGDTNEEETATLELTGPENPPSIRWRNNESLTLLYERLNDRPRALIAAREAERLHEIIDALAEASENEWKYRSWNLEREKLAAREEEAGEYREAAEDYLAARKFTDPKLFYDAVFFEIDLGRARSVRKTGDSKTAAELCGKWRARALNPIHAAIDWSPGAMDWGGSDVARARWEFSCGDFHKGVEELFQSALSRLEHPSDKWGAGSLRYYLEAPYDALDSAFLSERDSELARRASELGANAGAVHSRGDVDKLKEMTKDFRDHAERIKK